MKQLALLLFVLSGCVAQTPPAELPLPELCRRECARPFGERLGAHAGVEAYSNCRPSCVYLRPSEVNGVYAGIRWQCVEYARRWLIVNQKLTFPSIDFAADLWAGVQEFPGVGGAASRRTRNVENGAAALPAVGDLLVYGREYLGTGHVAVVVGVDEGRGRVRVAEENFRNEPWKGDFSREIPVVRRGATYWLLDPYLLGWKTVK